ncbi:MAG: sugar ABC transporter permease, partial [Angelakisella sp.]
MRKRSRFFSWENRRAHWGWFFILPWLIGAIFFFLVPMVQTVIFAFSEIKVTENGFETTLIGFKNITNFFTKDPRFLKNLTDTLVGVLPQILVIISFSLFIAVILRDNFRGRTFFRALFFLPVIISAGVVITILKENIMATSTDISAGASAYLFKAPDFSAFFEELGVPALFLSFINQVMNMTFDLTWKSGVQILLLLAAINNIPSSSYEVANIEGATEWEKFWMITFPLISPTLFVAVIYTIIDSFTDYGNVIMKTIMDYSNRGIYSYSAAV